ncbi:MAG TPA: L,D-transpeptidase family protein [Devosiaceae bacterium]|nr:L,D-transpeptidase family protein [Devosiaceae bacterium]
MGGRALVAAFGAASQVILLVGLVAGAAYAAESPADGVASAPPAAPAHDDLSVFPAPASGAEDGSPLSPAAAPDGEIARAPADATDTAATPPRDADRPPTETAATAPSDLQPAPAEGAGPADAAAPSVAEEPKPAHPVVAVIRDKLKDPALRKGAAAADLAALEVFYAERTEPPIWITGMGFSARAQALIAEIQKAGEWGLPAEAFDLPPASHLPATAEEQAIDELKLDLAALKYARFARGGRLTPARVSPLFDQKSNLVDPKMVLIELAGAASPGAYLVSLQPKHDQFEGLRQVLLKAVAASKAKGRKSSSDGAIQRLIVNMERWRWMPPSLGSYYVWNNIPAFSTRVVKGGKSIYVEKAIVGQVKYATPIFSADMRSIVFNPDWTVPETIKIEDLQPRLRQMRDGVPDTSVLRDNQLTVSYRGRPVDAETVDWQRANILSYTFTQAPGPDNVLGSLKFNFPNRHAVYMHDTVQPELFKQTVRTLSHGCIRVHQPDRLALVLLAEDKGWTEQQVKDQLARGRNSGIVLSRPVPVHLTYFTVAFDGIGKMRTYDDVYGLDKKMAEALFGKAEAISDEEPTVAKPKKRSASNGGRGFGGVVIPGLFGN